MNHVIFLTLVAESLPMPREAENVLTSKCEHLGIGLMCGEPGQPGGFRKYLSGVWVDEHRCEQLYKTLAWFP